MPYNSYNPYGGAGYQPYQTRQEVVRVNGRNGAEMYQIPANSSVLLLDESAPIVWLKTTDGAGYPTLTPYTITPYKPEEPVDLHSLEDRIAKLEERLNDKSDFISSKRRNGSNSSESAKN